MKKLHKCNYCGRVVECTIPDDHTNDEISLTCEQYNAFMLRIGEHFECYGCMEDRWREQAYEENGGGFW